MEFRQLEYFHMVGKLKNFTRAAELLHVSQPSVTKAIKILEAELKITLIDRSQKHVTLTPEGEVFFVHAGKILRAAEEALAEMGKFQSNKQGVLKLGIPPMIEAYLFPDIFTSFKHQYPNIELHILEYNSSQGVHSKLEEGEIDLGILLGGNEPTKNGLVIMEDRMGLCVSQKHPLRKEKSVGFEQLRKEKFVLQHPATYQYKEIYARCVEAGFTPDVLLCTAQIKTIKQLVANDSGVALLLNLVTRNETNFDVVPVEPPMRLETLLIWSGNRCLSQAGHNFVEFIKEYIRSPEFHSFLATKGTA